MKKYIVILLIILSFPQVLSAGRYAGDFILIGSGVRPLGMGGAFTAVADEGSAIYWNAAGLAQIQDIEFSAMHTLLYDNLATYDFFSLSIPLPANSTIGISFTQLSIDDIHIYDEKWIVGDREGVDVRSSDIDLHLTGDPDGSFDSSDKLFEFALSKNFLYLWDVSWIFFKIPLDFYLGGTFKYIKRDIYKNTGTGMGVDLSFMLETDFALLTDIDWLGSIRYGLSVQDVAGTSITWDTESRHVDKIITNPRMGIAIIQPLDFIQSELILSFDWYNMYGYEQSFGAEFDYNDLISIRTGVHEDKFSAGIGLKYREYSVDYAFLANNDLGSSHRVGLKITF
jgi:hypothetical protein